ncbi:Uncharacterized conserved protein, DUF305 family [Sinosporangium album]|uniref:Uncharacterized conserved protein, DUF305 family n=1 Tax=Sinosporangium album TaxID=504805 RepID=A0A1G7W027_9ACTN|nr:DUF305 domain-containing protein [Sinosporangium album]SDG64490.1 Uncharacterized conserved protein, DUF305 family [Sinosporangium album]
MPTTRSRALIVFAAIAGATLLTGACTAEKPGGTPEPQAAAAPTAPAVPVIAPGKPGESASTLAPDALRTAVPSPVANAADVRYAQDMIVHHRQALDMSVLAPSRAVSTTLKGLASRIKDTQGPEIQAMTAWLQHQGLRAPDHGHGHATSMPGMVSPERMEALKDATGEEFDRLFLELMISHHQGAITMAETALAEGSHVQIEEMAADVIAVQASEIKRMREMQATG